MKSYISIDIGEKNLGWTFASFRDGASDIKDFHFMSGVFDYKTTRGRDMILNRVASLTDFFKTFNLQNLELAVVERQVPTNHVACELMYAVVAILYQHTSNVIIFDPKLKFSHIGQTYDTKNKKHKKQSIENMRRMLLTNESESFTSLLDVLSAAEKKDDIADSFNQLIIEMSILGIIKRDLREIYNTELPISVPSDVETNFASTIKSKILKVRTKPRPRDELEYASVKYTEEFPDIELSE